VPTLAFLTFPVAAQAETKSRQPESIPVVICKRIQMPRSTGKAVGPPWMRAGLFTHNPHKANATSTRGFNSRGKVAHSLGKVEAFAPPDLAASQGAPASSDQVEDQDDDRHNDEKVDQGAADMESEAEEPQHQKNHEDCPKHIFLFRSRGTPGKQFSREACKHSQSVASWRRQPLPLRSSRRQGSGVPSPAQRFRRAEFCQLRCHARRWLQWNRRRGEWRRRSE